MAIKKYLIFIILGLGLVLRLVNLGQSFWLDEASQAQQSSFSLSYIWSNRQSDFHPPLFYILAHYWLQLGRSEVWLRLLPVTFGVINIYILFLLGKKFFPQHKFSGEFAAFLFAIAPFGVYYSQEFRMYSLLCLLGSLSLLFFYSKRFWPLVITNVLILYTHYSGIFLLFSETVIYLAINKKHVFKLLAHWVLIFIMFLPWLPQFLHQLQSGINIDVFLPGWRQILSVPSYKAVPLVVFKLVAGRINLLPQIIYDLYIAFVMLVTFMAVIVSRVHRKLLISWVVLPLFLLIITSLFLPQSQPFRVIYLLPAFTLLFTGACIRYPKLFFTLLIYIAIVGNVLYFTRPRLQREQWRQALEFLQKQDTLVVIKFMDNFAPIYWYTPHLPTVAVVPTFPAQSVDVTSRLSAITTNKIFLMDYLTGLTDPNAVTETALTNLGFKSGRTFNYEGVGFITEYLRP